jgi:hypothetical protein
MQDYVRAEKLDNALGHVRQTDIAQGHGEIRERKEQSFRDRKAFLEDRKNQIDREHEEKEAVVREAGNDRYYRLSAKHEDEVKSFKAKWQDPSFLSQYTKPSQQLLTLRNLEKKMALGKRYDEARRTKQMADSLKSKEESRMQKELNDAMKREFIKLRERQAQELEKMEAHENRLLEELELQRQRKHAPLDMALQQLVDVKKNVKVSKRTYVVPKAVIMGQQAPDDLDQSTMSPHTRKGMITYRNSVLGEVRPPYVSDASLSRLMGQRKPKKKKQDVEEGVAEEDKVE